MSMLNRASMTGVGMAIYIVTSLLAYYDIAVDTATIEGAVNGLAQIVSFTLMVIGQIRRKDLKMGLFRK